MFNLLQLFFVYNYSMDIFTAIQRCDLFCFQIMFKFHYETTEIPLLI